MSIAPFSPSPAAKAAGPFGKSHDGVPGGDAGSDSALGFLAQLAAAIGAVGPIGQTLSIPTGSGSDTPTDSGARPDLLAGTPTPLPLSAGTATDLPLSLSGGPASPLLARTDAAVAAATGPASGQGALGATHAVPLPGSAAFLSTAPAPDPSDPDGGPQNGPIDPTLVAPHAARGSVAPPIGPFSGRPAGQAPSAAGHDQHRASHPTSSRSSEVSATGVTDRAARITTEQAALGTAAMSADQSPTASALADATDALASIAAAAGTSPHPAAAVSTTDATTGPAPQQTGAVLRQVFPEITKVATTPGSHRLSITLHPDDLGEVRLTVVVRGDSVRVNVATDPTNGVARAALEHGAPELRRLLEATGADARVAFGDLAGGSGLGLGSATDSGRQQSQGWAQAQHQAQSHAEAQTQAGSHDTGRDRSAYAGGQDSPGVGPHRRASDTGSERPSPIPTTRSAVSGLDRLI